MTRRRSRAAVASLACALTLTLVSCTRDVATPPESPDLAETIESALSPALDPSSDLAVLLTIDGERVFEHYQGKITATTYSDVASVTKSVTSLLVGIALGEGDIDSVDATLASLLPAHASKLPPRVAGTTLREVLTMTGGFVGEMQPDGFDFARADDPVRRIALTAVQRPGAGFIYSSAGSQLLSAVLEEQTGQSMLSYARSRLFDPLGIDTRPAVQMFEGAADPEPFFDAYYTADFAWPLDREGRHVAWGRLKLRPPDLMKLGRLLLQGGRWDGRQVVPAEWVREATAPQVETGFAPSPTTSYGYQFWLTRRASTAACPATWRSGSAASGCTSCRRRGWCW